MDRYKTTFAHLKKQRRLGFCPFAVLGDPTEAQMLERVKKYIEAGADFLELGIPFSDPTADGPTIQAASEHALKNGMTPKKAIALVKKIRRFTLTKQLYHLHPTSYHLIPIGILTYSNIILRYGIEKFYRDLKRADADSVLIADVPLEEIAPFARAAKKYKLHQIFLISEYTDAARLKKIQRYASGFLYVTSVLGVTGARKNLPKNLKHLIHTLKRKTKLPLVVGFGISKPEHVKQLARMGTDGFIVGSALVKTPLKRLSGAVQKFALDVRRGRSLPPESFLHTTSDLLETDRQ